MATTTTPGYTGNAAANVIAAAALAASATVNANLDISTKFGAWIHVNNTPGGTISAVRGLKVEVFRRFGSTPTTAATAFLPFTLPSAVISTLESLDFFLPGPNKFNIKLTNLDAAQGLTEVSVTSDTFDDLDTV
jgi:hypothetical protein